MIDLLKKINKYQNINYANPTCAQTIRHSNLLDCTSQNRIVVLLQTNDWKM